MSFSLKDWKETGTKVQETFENVFGTGKHLTLEFERVEKPGWTRVFEVLKPSQIDGTVIRRGTSTKQLAMPPGSCGGTLIVIETEAEISGRVTFMGTHTLIQQARVFQQRKQVRAEWEDLPTDASGRFYATAPLECLFCRM